MDSDLSHDPVFLPRMVKLAETHDIVLGSRLCRGGKIIGRSLLRDFASYITNKSIKMITRIPIFDWTTGFRVYHRSVWEEVMPNVHCNKWDFQFESLYKAIKAGKSVTELPITFFERADGASKFKATDALVFLISFIEIILGFK